MMLDDIYLHVLSYIFYFWFEFGDSKKGTHIDFLAVSIKKCTADIRDIKKVQGNFYGSFTAPILWGYTYVLFITIFGLFHIKKSIKNFNPKKEPIDLDIIRL